MKVNRGTLGITSASFAHAGRLPDAHTTNGAGFSPALEWSGVPEGTKSFALIVIDPDAPVIDGWVHWVLSGIPADATGIPEGGGREYPAGINSKGRHGWTPAAPPPGHGTHHYFFHLYALDTVPDVPADVTAAELTRIIDPHVINQARIVGTYSND